MFRSLLPPLGVLLFAIAALPAIACDKTEGAPVIRLKVSSPLTMLQHGPATDVAIDATGCVTTRFPAIDRRHGTHRYQLKATQFDALKREIQAARLADFDASRVKAKLAAPKAVGEIEHVWTDADIVELELGAGIADAKSARSASIRWSGVEASLMNRPDLAELQSLAAVKARLIDLGTEVGATQETVR